MSSILVDEGISGAGNVNLEYFPSNIYPAKDKIFHNSKNFNREKEELQIINSSSSPLSISSYSSSSSSSSSPSSCSSWWEQTNWFRTPANDYSSNQPTSQLNEYANPISPPLGNSRDISSIGMICSSSSSSIPGDAVCFNRFLFYKSDRLMDEALAAEKQKKRKNQKKEILVESRIYSSNVMTQIQELIVLPIAHPELFTTIGIRLSRAILVTGQIGVGKTYLINSLIKQLGIHNQSLDATTILLKYQQDEIIKLQQAQQKGQEEYFSSSASSSSFLSFLFKTARKYSPSILFIDDIELILGIPSPNDSTAIIRLRNEFKYQLATLSAELTNPNHISTGKDNKDSKSKDECSGCVLVIGCSNRPDLICPSFRRCGLFEKEIILSAPGDIGRYSLLKGAGSTVKLHQDIDWQTIVQGTEGFVASDIADLFKEAALLSIKRLLKDRINQNETNSAGYDNSEETLDSYLSLNFSSSDYSALSIRMDDLLDALPLIVPSSRRTFSLLPSDSPDFSFLGGFPRLKSQLTESILHPLTYKNIFEQFGLPAGCGKTLFARAVAKISRASFLMVKGPELLSSYLGESEKNIRELFAKAKAAAPSVIFFDEIDSIAQRRSIGEHGTTDTSLTDRIVNQLLIEMEQSIHIKQKPKKNVKTKIRRNEENIVSDSFSSNSYSFLSSTQTRQELNSAAMPIAGERGESIRAAIANLSGVSSSSLSTSCSSESVTPLIFVIAATNRPESLDPALLRPGRFDESIYVGLPNEQSRLDILKKACNTVPIEEEIKKNDWQILRSIAQRTKGFSGADLSAIIQQATRAAIQRNINDHNKNIESIPLTEENNGADLYYALASSRPSVTKEQRIKFKLFNQLHKQMNQQPSPHSSLLSSLH